MSKKHSNNVIHTNKYKCPCLPQSSSENGWSLREEEDIALLVTGSPSTAGPRWRRSDRKSACARINVMASLPVTSILTRCYYRSFQSRYVITTHQPYCNWNVNIVPSRDVMTGDINRSSQPCLARNNPTTTYSFWPWLFNARWFSMAWVLIKCWLRLL